MLAFANSILDIPEKLWNYTKIAALIAFFNLENERINKNEQINKWKDKHIYKYMYING